MKAFRNVPSGHISWPVQENPVCPRCRDKDTTAYGQEPDGMCFRCNGCGHDWIEAIEIIEDRPDPGVGA